MTAEFRHFIQEEHAMMGEADLTRTRIGAASHKGDVRDGVVRGARPLHEQAAASGQRARNGMDGRAFQCFVERQRQDSGKPSGRHCLAGAGPTISRL